MGRAITAEKSHIRGCLSRVTEKAWKSIVTLDRNSSGEVNARSYTIRTQIDEGLRGVRCVLTDVTSNESCIASMYGRVMCLP